MNKQAEERFSPPVGDGFKVHAFDGVVRWPNVVDGSGAMARFVTSDVAGRRRNFFVPLDGLILRDRTHRQFEYVVRTESRQQVAERILSASNGLEHRLYLNVPSTEDGVWAVECHGLGDLIREARI